MTTVVREVLPPLPPGDYSRSTQEAAYAAQWGYRRQRAHRQVDIPFWTAPVGYCRWCGEDVGVFLKSGKRNVQARWHGRCIDTYNELRPAAQRSRLWPRELGECAGCGRFCPERPKSGYRTWQCDHVVPLVDGGPNDDANLQLLCDPCHKAKTAREARARAAVRRLDPSVPSLFEDAI